MDSSNMAFSGKILDLISSLTLSPSICCCFQTVSVVVALDHSIAMSTKEVIVSGEILQVDHPLSGLLDGKDLHECRGGHERHSSIDVVFSTDNWELVAKHHDTVILVGATVDHSRIRLLANDRTVGVLPFDRRKAQRSEKVRVAEIFAGAYSGWSHAVNALNKERIPVDHLWMLDFDITCARSYVKTHFRASLCDSPTPIVESRTRSELDDGDFFQDADPLYVVADLSDKWWMSVVDVFDIDILMASPPCPAWSLADKAPGLARDDGVVLLVFFLMAGYLKPKTVTLENVAGLLVHKDWPLVLKIIRFAGFEIHWQHTCDLVAVVPQHRDRCLLILTLREVDDLPKLKLIRWPNGASHTLGTYDAIFYGSHPWVDDAMLTQEELDLYLSLSACPKAAKTKSSACTMEDMYKYRIRRKGDVASCFLTSYGKPLRLSADLVKRGGVLGSLFLDGNELRKFTPLEAALLLGTADDQWISFDWQTAFHQLGNAISRPHALLALLNSILTISTFPWLDDPQMLMVDLMNEHLCASCLVIRPVEDGVIISKPSADLNHEIPPTLPMKQVSRLVILGDAFGCELQCEQGVDLRVVLQLLFGYEAQFQVSMPLAKPLKKCVPLPQGMTMPAYDFVLKIQGNPKLVLNEKYFATRSSVAGAMVAFTTKGLLVLNSTQVYYPADVLMAVHLLSWFEDDTLSCDDLQGQSHPADKQCPTFVFVSEHHADVVPVGFDVQDLYLQPVADAFHALIPAGQEQVLLMFLEHSGILQAIMALGWHLTLQLRVQTSGMALLVLASVAGRPAISAQAMQHFVMARLFHKLLLRQCVNMDQGVCLQLKMWNTIIWNGQVDATITGNVLSDLWRKAAGVFGNAADVRYVVEGKVVSPDRPCVEFAKWHDSEGVASKIQMTFQPRGGGSHGASDLQHVESPVSPIQVDEEFPDPVALEAVNFERAISVILRQIMQRCIPDRVFYPETIRGLKIEQVNGMLQMQASIPDTISFMQLLRHLGVEDAVEDMGWSVFLQFCRFEHPAVVRMTIVPRPGVQHMSREAVLAIILGALYAFSLPRPVPLSGDVVYTKVKLWDCWVFEGYLDGMTPCDMLLRHWVDIGAFVSREEVFRLVCHGKQASNEFPIKEYSRVDAFNRRVASFHLIRRLRGGGKGPPPSQISQVKTDLATFLLKSGADLKEVSIFVDKILMVVGVPTLSRITAIQESHMKLDAIEKLAQSVNVKPPTIQQTSTRNQSQPKKQTQSKQRVCMKAKDFRIQDGFFKKESGEPCERCECVQAGAHGIVLLDPEDAYAWVKDPLKISPDECGILILGTCPIKGSL
eukprot:Skav209122  [mRNA]  locus=scaffold682:20734:24684:+ [translate_table: standard]